MIVGEHVVSDLDLTTISSFVPLKTTWGHAEFQTQLMNPTDDMSVIKRRQLPLMAFRRHLPITMSIASKLATLNSNESLCEPRFAEGITLCEPRFAKGTGETAPD